MRSKEGWPERTGLGQFPQKRIDGISVIDGLRFGGGPPGFHLQ